MILLLFVLKFIPVALALQAMHEGEAVAQQSPHFACKWSQLQYPTYPGRSEKIYYLKTLTTTASECR